jgi:hypothetical protein
MEYTKRRLNDSTAHGQATGGGQEREGFSGVPIRAATERDAPAESTKRADHRWPAVPATPGSRRAGHGGELHLLSAPARGG